MASWAALNTTEDGDHTNKESSGLNSNIDGHEKTTQEALDAHNAVLYERALRCHQHHKIEDAKTIYMQVLNSSTRLNERLKYLCYKNVAVIEMKHHKDYEQALLFYAEALAIDQTDVLVWYEMGMTALLTGRLWLARHCLEQGFEIDPTFWPLVEGLCEVLYAIRDEEEYHRMASYLLAHDPNCPSVLVMNAALQRGEDQILPVNLNKVQKRQRERIEHFRSVAANARHKRQRIEVAEHDSTPVEYVLHQCSWHALGKLLLGAYEDSCLESSTSERIIRLCVDFSQKPPTSQDRLPASDGVVDLTVEHPSPIPIVLVDSPQSTIPQTQDLTEVANNLNDPDDENLEQDQDIPSRRKSKRRAERVKEEYQVAFRRARELNLAYRLEEILMINSNEDSNQAVGSSITSAIDVSACESPTFSEPRSRSSELLDSAISMSEDGWLTLTHLDGKVAHTLWCGRRVTTTINELPDTSKGVDTHDDPMSQDSTHLDKHQIQSFLEVYASGATVKEMLRLYLNQCGDWAHLKLGGDVKSDVNSEGIHAICFWAEKVIEGELSKGNTSESSRTSHRISLYRQRHEHLTINARLYLLELRLDLVLSQPPLSVFTTTAARRHEREELVKLQTQVQRILLDLCIGTNEMDLESTANHNEPSQSLFIRLFWLQAQICERLRESAIARSLYMKCLDQMKEMNMTILHLPNLHTEKEISIITLEKKITSLQFSDIGATARTLFSGGEFDQARELLMSHFFSMNETSSIRMIELLRDFGFEHEQSNQLLSVSDDQNKILPLFELLIICVEQSLSLELGQKISILLSFLHDTVHVLHSVRDKEPVRKNELCPLTLEVVEFLVQRLYVLVTTNPVPSSSEPYCCILRVMTAQLLQPQILFLFETPREIVTQISTIHQSVGLQNTIQVCPCSPPSNEGHLLVLALLRSIHVIQTLTTEDFNALFAILPTSGHTKKKISRRDRVRMCMIEMISILNTQLIQQPGVYENLESLSIRNVLMDLCKLVHEEEDTCRQHDKLGQQLFTTGATLMIQLVAATRNGDDEILVSLVEVLHERLGKLELCGTKCVSINDDGRSSFLDVVIHLMNHRRQFSIAQEESEKEELMLAQCYTCLYGIHVLPGCVDHKTGGTITDLLSEKFPIIKQHARQMAEFVIPIMLKRKSVNNPQKKENLMILNAIRDALDCDTAPSTPSSDLLEYLAPIDLLRWYQPLPLIVSSKESSCLHHLWFLLGENHITTRVRNRSDAKALLEVELKIKQRLEYLLKDVQYYCPSRIQSWINMGRVMKELYQMASDACVLTLGRQRKVLALLSYTTYLASTPRECRGWQPTFKELVLETNFFAKLQEWQDFKDETTQTAYRVCISSYVPTSNTNDTVGSSNEVSWTMEEYTVRFIVQLIEFSRRSFHMAAALAETQLTTAQDEMRDELSDIIVECREECGLLLYNILQEFSVLRHQTDINIDKDLLRQFPMIRYRRIIDTALLYFRDAVEASLADPDAHIIRFRLHYMIGKTLKKLSWCDRHTINPISQNMGPVILESFANAEQAHEEGKMERSIVQAFYHLQAIRMNLVLTEPVTIENLRAVCTYYFEEESNEEESIKERNTVSTNDDLVTDNTDEKLNENVDIEGIVKASESKNVKVDKTVLLDLLREAETCSNDMFRVGYMHLVRVWLFFNTIDALESISNEDRYFHPSRYVLAQSVYRLDSMFHPSLYELKQAGNELATLCITQLEQKRTITPIVEPQSLAVPATLALKELAPLFDKRRPQIVAIWLSDHITATKKFEELNQRHMKFDFYRLKYWRLYIQLLCEVDASARLKEMMMWVLACKEEHDVIDEMLAIVIDARGVVLLNKMSRLMASMSCDRESESCSVDEKQEDFVHTPLVSPCRSRTDENDPAEVFLKYLSKAYIYYIDVMKAERRLRGSVSTTTVKLIIQRAKWVATCLYIIGVHKYPILFEVFQHEEILTPLMITIMASRIAVILRTKDLPVCSFESVDSGEVNDIDWPRLWSATLAFCEDRWPERAISSAYNPKQINAKPSRARGNIRNTTTASKPVTPPPSNDIKVGNLNSIVGTSQNNGGSLGPN